MRWPYGIESLVRRPDRVKVIMRWPDCVEGAVGRPDCVKSSNWSRASTSCNRSSRDYASQNFRHLEHLCLRRAHRSGRALIRINIRGRQSGKVLLILC